MLTAVLMFLLFTLGYHDTKSAQAFLQGGFSVVRKTQRGKFVSSGSMSIAGADHLIGSAGTRASCHRCAAKNVENANSKDPSSSALERSNGEPWYWIDEKCDHNFEATFEDGDESKNEEIEEECKSKRIVKLRFKICGNPRPLQRHRTSRRHVYNPSAKYQKSFQDAVEKLVFDLGGQSIDSPLFDATEYLAMTIIFRMKRPKNHFVNNRPGPGRLKAKSPPQLSSIRSDVDNLTKFVLDSMNGVMYEDDRQITSIHAIKLLDNEDLCDGSIEVHVRSIALDDVEKIVESSISIVEQYVK